MGCLHSKLTADSGIFYDASASPSASAAAAAPSLAAGRQEPLRAPAPPRPADLVAGRGVGVVRIPSLVRRNSACTEWPAWLSAAAGDALAGLIPRRADSFQMLEKVGSGTYSNVYKARDMATGRLVALKKVRVEEYNGGDGGGKEDGAQFMAREIALLRRLDHPNVVRLEGVAASRVPWSTSVYLVFEYMDHDLAGLLATNPPGVVFTEPQIKCYMKQLLSGLEHCHNQGVLHRDIKCANLLINKEGILKIGDFGLATSYDPNNARPMTSRVVTLWYRPPELLLGATHYGIGVDLWSVGCILAELLTGKPILPGRTEVEQLHRIFKLCGSPPEDYRKKLQLAQKARFKTYKSSLLETFADYPPPSVALVKKLLSLEPDERGTTTDALNSDFFNTEPYACEPSSLPKYPPSKEMDAKMRDYRTAGRKRRDTAGLEVGVSKSPRLRNSSCRELRSLGGNAKLHTQHDRRRLMASASARSGNEKFPPPHLDASMGRSFDAFHVDSTESLATTDERSASSSSLSMPTTRTVSSSHDGTDYSSTADGRRFTNSLSSTGRPAAAAAAATAAAAKASSVGRGWLGSADYYHGGRASRRMDGNGIMSIGAFRPAYLIGGHLTGVRRKHRATVHAKSSRREVAVGAVK